MTEPTTDRERLIASEGKRMALDKELGLILKSLASAEIENIRLREIAQRDAAYNDQRDKNIITHLFGILKLGGAVIAGILGAKFGFKL